MKIKHFIVKIALVLLLTSLTLPLWPKKVLAISRIGPTIDTQGQQTDHIELENAVFINDYNLEGFGRNLTISWKAYPLPLGDKNVNYKITRWTRAKVDDVLGEMQKKIFNLQDLKDGLNDTEFRTCQLDPYVYREYFYAIPRSKIRTCLELAGKSLLPRLSPGFLLEFDDIPQIGEANQIDFHDFSDLVFSKINDESQNFYASYLIESFYNRIPGPKITLTLSSVSDDSTEKIIIDQIQRYYNDLLSDGKTMFESIEKNQYWTDDKSVPEWISEKFADWVNAGLSKLLEVAAVPKFFIDQSELANEKKLYPTTSGWNLLYKMNQNAIHIKHEIPALEEIKKDNDVLAKEFTMISINPWQQQTTLSFKEMKTDVLQKTEIIATKVDEAIKDATDDDVSGVCMGKEGLQPEEGGINILGFIACLVNMVADQILKLAVSWMATFAGI